MHRLKSVIRVGQLWHHPVLRSSLLLSFTLLVGMSAMTRFAAVMSNKQSEINDRIKSMIDLKHMLVHRDSPPAMGEHLDNFDTSLQENYVYQQRRLKTVVKNLDCVFKDFSPGIFCLSANSGIPDTV